MLVNKEISFGIPRQYMNWFLKESSLSAMVHLSTGMIDVCQKKNVFMLRRLPAMNGKINKNLDVQYCHTLSRKY